MNYSQSLYRIAIFLVPVSMCGVNLCSSVFCKIKDFDIPAPVVKNFLHTNDAVLDIVMPNNWCHILPRCVFVFMCACMNRLLYTATF